MLERYLYGSDKLGVIKGTNQVASLGWIYYSSGPSTRKYYELHDHLGNTRVVLSAATLPAGTAPSLANYYNYYAFGSYEPGRAFEPNMTYAFGFNGQQKRDDWRVSGGSYDFGARNYNARIGRWITIDPLAKKYASVSPYIFTMNDPIVLLDPDGKVVELYDIKGRKVATITKEGQVIEKGMENSTILQAYNEAKEYLKGHDGGIFNDVENNPMVLNIFESNSKKSPKFDPEDNFEVTSVDDDYDGSKPDRAERATYNYKDKNKAGKFKWNPKLGMKDDQGNDHSPALVLAHELHHARLFMTDLKEYIVEAFKDSKEFDKVIEKIAIEFINKVIEHLGNGDGSNGDWLRSSHGGKGQPTSGPISNH